MHDLTDELNKAMKADWIGDNQEPLNGWFSLSGGIIPEPWYDRLWYLYSDNTKIAGMTNIKLRYD